MRINVPLLPSLLLVICSANAAAATGDPLDQTAVVMDIADFPTEPCTTNFTNLNHGEEWPIKPGSKFKIEKPQSGIKHHIAVDSDPSNAMGVPDLYVLNGNLAPLATNYCTHGGDLKSHLYLFGIHDLEDPADQKKSLHAFIYVPMRLKAQTASSLVDEFYLIVFSIMTDSKQCKGSDRTRCLALRRLVVKQADYTEAEFVEAIKKEMKNIVPKKPRTVMGFHNGVIHGTF